MPNESREPLIITDLVERTIEDGVLSQDLKKDRWYIRDYELEQIGPGRGLEIFPWQVNAPGDPGPITIRLGVAGYYRISLITRYSTVRLKLSGQRCFEQCEPVRTGPKMIGQDDIYREGYYDCEEVLWKQADLTGQDLIIDNRMPVCLLAIRLTPIETPEPDARPIDTPMMYTNDGGRMGANLLRSPEELVEREERMSRDGCTRVLVYGGIHGDVCTHFTKVGTEWGALHDPDESWREHDATIVRNMQQFRKWGINPAQAAVEYAHERGWELHFYIRMRGWESPIEFRKCKESRFFRDHPQYRNVGRHGEPVMGMSIAYPQVREHLARLCAELAGFGADGVTFCYPRGAMSVLYEPIVVDGFKKEYGLDPRKLDELDPRWLDYTAGIVTTFIRQCKAAVGDGCRLSPMIHGTQALNRRFGLDIATWVADGIVDDLFIMGHQVDRHGGHHAGGPQHLDFAYFQNLPGRQNVRLWPMFYMYSAMGAYPWKWEQYWQVLQDFFQQGADGYGLWDFAAMETDLRANLDELGKTPPGDYRVPQRLLAKYELVRWDGFLWNQHTPIDGT